MTKEPLRSDGWKKRRAKKDTNTFCKGIEGRYHSYEFVHAKWDPLNHSCGPREGKKGWYWGQATDENWVCFHDLKCSVCGKTNHTQKFYCPDRP